MSTVKSTLRKVHSTEMSLWENRIWLNLVIIPKKKKPNKVGKKKKKRAEINEIRKRENNSEKPMKPKASS